LTDWALDKDSGNRYVLYFQNKIPEDDFLKSDNFELRLIKGPQFLKKHRIITEQLLLPFELWNDRLDIFFATWYSAPIILPKTKTIIAAWDISYSTHPEHYSLANRFSLGFFSKWSCKKADGIITCSDYDSLQIQKYYMVPPEKIKTVYLAADERFVKERNERKIEEVKKKYNLPDKFLLSLGVIYNRRNVDVIINSFYRIENEFSDNIEKLMEPAIQNKKGVYMPWFADDDLPFLYQASEFYICTSTVDGETILLKEAMKSGTPVITSNLLSGTIGGNGYIISNPNSVQETVSVLKKALLSSELTEKYVLQGVDWNLQFDWGKVSSESLDFIETTESL
jgi:glycosyltransferase involved in cell wall biosynthesis